MKARDTSAADCFRNSNATALMLNSCRLGWVVFECRSEGGIDSESLARHNAQMRRFQFLDRCEAQCSA